ncbi:MAG: hypothetical protein ACO3NK_13035, partial [Prochlorotrichaceae cyanobacterium]
MIITTPIQTYKLPKDLYPDRLENELQQFSDVDWQNFAQGLPLIALGGKLTNDLPLSSGLKPTSLLTQCPTLQNWLSQSSIVLGRTRIVQLKSEEQRSYNDSQTYYQSVHRSLWIPLLNADQCSLKIQGESFSLDPNRLYLFNPSDRYSLSYHGNDRFLALWIETPLDFDLPNWINNPYQFKLDLKPTLSIVPYCFRVINP